MYHDKSCSVIEGFGVTSVGGSIFEEVGILWRNGVGVVNWVHFYSLKIHNFAEIFCSLLKFKLLLGEAG